MHVTWAIVTYGECFVEVGITPIKQILVESALI
jgi:hypothetical protein